LLFVVKSATDAVLPLVGTPPSDADDGDLRAFNIRWAFCYRRSRRIAREFVLLGQYAPVGRKSRFTHGEVAVNDRQCGDPTVMNYKPQT
jgi:hypothetical protein